MVYLELLWGSDIYFPNMEQKEIPHLVMPIRWSTKIRWMRLLWIHWLLTKMESSHWRLFSMMWTCEETDIQLRKLCEADLRRITSLYQTRNSWNQDQIHVHVIGKLSWQLPVFTCAIRWAGLLPQTPEFSAEFCFPFSSYCFGQIRHDASIELGGAYFQVSVFTRYDWILEERI